MWSRRASRTVLFSAVISVALAVVFLTLHSPFTNAQSAVDLAVDMDTAGNTATSVGTLESCNAIDAVGDTLEIDVVVEGVPPYDPQTETGGLAGFQFDLMYNPAVVNISAFDAAMMLTAAGEAIPASASDPPPDSDGDFLVGEADLGNNLESGDGVLIRITLQAVGEGTTTLELTDRMHGVPMIIDASNSTAYSLSSVLDGVVSVGEPCDPNWTPTPVPSPTTTPTPAPTPVPSPTITPTPTPPPTSSIDLVAVDMDITGNGGDANGGVIGATEYCNSIANVGDTLQIDVIVNEVPADRGAAGLSFMLDFDPSIVHITDSSTTVSLIGLDPDSDLYRVADTTSTDGSFNGGVADMAGNIPGIDTPPFIAGDGNTSETGPGVLLRFTLTAKGIGESPLTLSRVVVGGGGLEEIPINNVLSGNVVVGGPCVITWPVPPGDTDSDGFADTKETFVETDPGVACDDEMGLPDWPPDFDDSEKTDIFDALDLKPHFNKASPDPDYSQRYDLDGSFKVDIFDPLVMKPFFNKNCTP